jgi:hypothetical protein
LNNKKKTLVELIIRNFIEISNGKRADKNSKKAKRHKKAPNPRFSISHVLINLASREIKDEIKKQTLEEAGLEEDDEGKIIKDDGKFLVNCGYGTINKHYGTSPIIKYTDYNKIWSHLGSFKTFAAYENDESSNKIAVKNGESSREMISMGTIDKAAKHFKYFVQGDVMGDIGLVPPAGANIDSKEWEKYRLMYQMSVYQPLLKLMWSMA